MCVVQHPVSQTRHPDGSVLKVTERQKFCSFEMEVMLACQNFDLGIVGNLAAIAGDARKRTSLDLEIVEDVKDVELRIVTCALDLHVN